MELVLYAVIVLGVLGAIFGAILAIASKIFAVEVDPKQAAVRECLAGANCGGCGFPGCDGYAAAVAKGEAPVNKCVAAGPAAAEKIAEIMGVSAGEAFTNGSLLGVNLYSEDLGGYCKNSTENRAENAENDNSINY